MATITGIGIGTTTITASYGGMTTSGVSLTVEKALRSGAVSCDNVTFGSTVTATVSGNTEGGTVTWTITNGTGAATINSSGVVTPTKAGKVTINASVGATTHYAAYTATSKTITIGVRTVTVTAPTKTDKTYNTNPQTIFAAGSCTAGGTMYYSESDTTFSTSTWSTTIPYTQKTAAGTYTIYWYCYVSDTTSNTGTNINTKNSIQATIGKASRSGAISCADTTYPSTVTATVSGNTEGGTVTWTITNGTGAATINSSGVVTPTKAGKVTINASVAATANYAAYTATSKEITISKRTVIITAPTKTNREYTGSAQNIFAGGSCTAGGTMYYSASDVAFSTSTWSTTIPYTQKTDAGTYTIYWYCYVSDTNNNAGTGINTKNTLQATISRGSRSGAVSCANVTYGSTVTASVSVDPSTWTGGTVTWGITPGTGTATINSSGVVTPTKVGTVTVTATVGESGNYAGYTATSKTITISQRTVTVTAPTKTDRTYNTNPQTIFTSGSCTAGGTMYYSASDVAFSTSTWSTTIPYTQKTAAGTYTIYWYCYVSDTTNNTGTNINTKNTLTATIGKASRSGAVSCNDTTYPTTVTATVLGNTENGVITWGITAGTGKATISGGVVTPTQAGTVTVTASVAETANYAAYTATQKTITINKRTVTVTAPTRTNRDYTGSAQTIFTAGSCTTGGTMYYSSTNSDFSTSTWTTTIPYTQKTDAGTYTIYWYCYVSDTTNNTGTNINTKNTLTATISQVAATPCSVWEGDSKGYDAAQTSPAVLTYTGYSGGTIKFRYDANGGTNYGLATTTAPTRNTVGTTRVQYMIEGDANHTSTNWSEPVTLTVNAETDASVNITLTARTYSGSAQVIATGSNLHAVASYKIGYIRKDIGASAPSQPTEDSQLTWGSEVSINSSLSATNAGDYYVYYTMSPGTGHTNSKTREYVGKVTISKASRSGAVSCADTTYPSTVTATVSGNTESGTVSWGITAGTGKATISGGVVTPTKAGTVTVTASVAATANYAAYTATPKTITIGKGTANLTFSTVENVTEPCTTESRAESQMQGDRQVTISTLTPAASSTTNTGVTITYAIDKSGWYIASNGKTITIPDGTDADTYTVKVTATVPATDNYNTKSVTNTITVVVDAQVLTGLSLALAASTIKYNGTTTATVIATYKYGEPIDVTTSATYSSSPTGIVSIS